MQGERGKPATASAVDGVASRVSAKIEAAFRRLHFNVGGEEGFSHTLALLTQIATTTPAPDTAFRRVGRARCEAELKTLCSAAERLVRAIDNLHEPTILALAAPPISWFARTEVKKMAQQVAYAACHADVSNVAAGVGVQPRNRPSLVVADIVANEYERITGDRPTVRTRDGSAYGPFFDLVRDVFIAMDINDSPEVAARVSARRRRLRQP